MHYSMKLIYTWEQEHGGKLNKSEESSNTMLSLCVLDVQIDPGENPPCTWTLTTGYIFMKGSWINNIGNILNLLNENSG